MISFRSQIIELIEQGAIPMERVGDALVVAKVTPESKGWWTFFDSLLLWLGGLALAFAGIFFIAYNWDELGRFAKFGMVEGFMVLAIVFYCKFAKHSLVSRVLLLIATISLGVLLALFGQTYQTGADSWQLFFNWALLMLPWALIGSFPAIWIVWVALMNISIVLYHQTFRGAFWVLWSSDTGMWWLTFFFNTFVLIIWEFLAKNWRWLSERWAIRLLALGVGVPITGLVLHAIFSRITVNTLAGPVWVVWLALMYVRYRKISPDLFMLAGCCLSVITVMVSFLSEKMLKDGEAGSFLFLAIVVIGLGTGAALWLKNVQEEWRV
ncbi:MAG: DUF2157 domain-containing protein [Nitrospirales bacterium]